MESILLTIKKMLAIESDFDGFDTDIIVAINTAFMSLNQLGIGPEDGYSINDTEKKWSDYFGAKINLEGVKTYIYLKTRLIFDPPSNSFLVDAIARQIEELEHRLIDQMEFFVTDPLPLPPPEPLL